MNYSNALNKLIPDLAALNVYRILAQQEAGVTGRALAALAGVSTFKMHHTLRALVAQGVITKQIVGRAHIYRLHHAHVVVRDVILFMLRYERELLFKLGESLMTQCTPRPISILVYGSVARGEELPDSDIDLLLVYANDATPPPMSEYGALMEWVTRTYTNPVSIRRARIADIQQPLDEHRALMRNIIKEGRAIAGLSLTDLLSHGQAHSHHTGTTIPLCRLS